MNAPYEGRTVPRPQDRPLATDGGIAGVFERIGIILPACDAQGWSADQLIGAVQNRYPDILYVLWRATDGRHRCSLGWTEQDVDQNVWTAAGASPSEAFLGALACALASVERAGDA